MANLQTLLRSALPHVPTLGFTSAALAAGLRGSPEAEIILQPSTLQALFPGEPNAETSVERSLFTLWDQTQLNHMKAGASERSKTQGGEDREATYARAVTQLERRLIADVPVRSHLLEAFALQSSLPLPDSVQASLKALAAGLVRALPPSSSVASGSLLLSQSAVGLPSPLPLVKRALVIADQACSTQSWTKEQQLGPDWYTTRARLAVAYMAGELHLVSPNTQEPGLESESQDEHGSSGTSLDASFALLRRIAFARDTSVFADIEQGVSSSREWIQWGGRGWLGILRSFGL